MDTSDKTRSILRALDFTPVTLSAKTGMTISQARRILRDGGRISASEFLGICQGVGISPDALVMGGEAI